MHLVTGYEDRKARIEIVPLIDVVFLLLVFFIYAMLSMTLYRGLKVDLPRGQGVASNLDALTITITADNTLQVDDLPVDFSSVVQAVQARRGEGSRPVRIRGDQSADFGIAVELLSVLRDAQIETVSFQVVPNP